MILFMGAMNLALVPARATTVEPMDLATAAEHAGQVIVGRVLSTRSYWADHPRRIETELTFTDVAHLKGEAVAGRSAATFMLIVPGGTIGETTMRIAGAPEFSAGETWILFLLPEYRTFPVVGVSQGAFRVAAGADGRKRVFDSEMRPVTGVEANGALSFEDLPSLIQTQRLRTQEGARVVEIVTAAGDERAMMVDEFIERLRPILDRSRPHVLNHPAGRPIPTVHKPSVIRKAEPRGERR